MFENFKDIVELAKAGWTLKDIKEVKELLSTSPTVDKDAAPEDLKKEAENKSVEKLPTEKKKEDPIDELKKLVKED